MTIEITIQEETAVPNGTRDAIHKASTALFEYLQVSRAELTILLADDQKVQELNHQFRGEDKATDVLSFPSGDDLALDGLDIPYLGDIAVAVPVAGKQAAASGHDLVEELQLLAIHGILHLLGYDHLVESEKQEMWRLQQAVLERIGLPHIQPTEGDDH